MGPAIASASSAVRAAVTVGRPDVGHVALLRLLSLPVFAAWIWWDASVSPSRLGSLGSVLVGLLAIGLLTQADEIALDRTRRVLIGALATFVGWNFLSIVWADFPAAAWTGSNRMLVYAVAFVLFFLWPWSDRARVLATSLVAIVVAGSSVAVVARILASSSPAQFLDEGRLAFPTGYANGSAALWTVGALLTLPLAAARELGPPARATLLGSTTILVGLGVLTQSRGWLLGLPIAAVLAVACGRARLRLVCAAVLVAIGVGAVARPLGDVFRSYASGEPLDSPLERALWLLLAAGAATAAAGWGWSWLDRRLAVPERLHRLVTIGAAAAIAIALAVGIGLGVRAVGNPGTWISDKWGEFTGGFEGSTGDSRLSGSLGSDRYQEWRIAVEVFAEHPIVGVGSDNYAAEYLLRRDDNRAQPVHPHSTPLRILSQLGIVGALCFGVFAVATLALAIGRRRAAQGLVATSIGAALSVFAFWLVAGSFDVLWEIPALAAPALALAGLAAARASDEQLETGETRDGWRRHLPTAFAGLLALGLASLVVTWASSSFTESGRSAGSSRPETAYHRLDLAADLNPLAALPLIDKGLIAEAAGQPRVARHAFEEALSREARNWLAAAELGLLEASQGEYEAAAASLERAQELNPRDPLLAIALRLVAARATVDPALFNQLYVDGLNRESVDWLVERYFDELAAG